LVNQTQEYFEEEIDNKDKIKKNREKMKSIRKTWKGENNWKSEIFW